MSSALNIGCYDDIAHLCRFVDLSGKRFHHSQVGGSSGLSSGQSIVRLRDFRQAPDYRSLIQQLRPAIHQAADSLEPRFMRPVRQWTEAPLGAFPVVPEILNGFPMPMRRMTVDEQEMMPVRIVVDASIAIGLPPKVQVNRAIGLAALVQRLSEARTVDIQLCASGRVVCHGLDPAKANQAAMVTLAAGPTQIDDLIFLLVDEAFPRHVALLALIAQSGAGSAEDCATDPVWRYETLSAQDIYNMRHAFGLQPEDLFLPAANLQALDHLARDPVGWVRHAMALQETLD